MSTLAQVRKVADRYVQQGYTVSLRPRGSQVPDFLNGFEPDLIAEKPGESVIVQITKREELASNPDLAFVADAASARVGWRLDLVVEGEPSRWPDSVSPAAEPNSHDITALVESSRRLASMGELTAACLTAWAAIEASLRAIAVKNGLRLDEKGPKTVLKTVYSHGLLSRAEYSLLEESLLVRNASAHGLRSPALSQDLVRVLLESAGQLAAAASRPAA